MVKIYQALLKSSGYKNAVTQKLITHSDEEHAIKMSYRFVLRKNATGGSIVPRQGIVKSSNGRVPLVVDPDRFLLEAEKYLRSIESDEEIIAILE